MEQKRMTQKLFFFSWIGLFGQVIIALYSLFQSSFGPPYSTICLFASILLPLVFWFGYGFAVGKGSRSIKIGALACGIFYFARLVLRVLKIISLNSVGKFWQNLYIQVDFLDSWSMVLISIFAIVFLIKFAANSLNSIRLSSILYILVSSASCFYYFLFPVMPQLWLSDYMIRFLFALASVPFFVSMIAYQSKHIRSLNI